MADIVPTHLAVQAMRDNGYKNAAYALAELMDNSIQAEATQVELLCGEKEIFTGQRTMRRIHQVAVLDNGSGMDSQVLTMALQFGNGTHLEATTQKGIGRFGMGLPASSISQAKRVDVWTWQQGPGNAIYSYLDLDEIRNQTMSSVPEPIQKSIPPVWHTIGKAFDKSGTLVVWSNLDRCIWRTAKAVIDNSELIIGRMYRHFLEDNRVTIRMVAFDFDQPTKFAPEFLLGSEFFAKPNDPGYLMSGTSCPPPYDTKPMFTKWGDDSYESTFTINFQGQDHDVKVRFSIAHNESRNVPNAGATPHGKHAEKNIGVSIIRADRELELDQSWVIKYDSRERWWGIEVEFPPSLDELFGVTNNKQSARNFSELAKVDIETLLKGKPISELKEEFAANEDPRGPLIEIAQRIDTQLKIMRKHIQQGKVGEREGRRRNIDIPLAEVIATEVTTKRKEEGHVGESDSDERLSNDERVGIIEGTLIDNGIEQIEAHSMAATLVSDNLKYTFINGDIETPAFFSVKPRGGAIIITLNLSHPAHEKLMEILEMDVEEADLGNLKVRLEKAREGLKLLLSAWARYEDEQPDGIRRTRVQDTRVEWGKMARQFFNQDNA